MKEQEVFSNPLVTTSPVSVPSTYSTLPKSTQEKLNQAVSDDDLFATFPSHVDGVVATNQGSSISGVKQGDNTWVLADEIESEPPPTHHKDSPKGLDRPPVNENKLGNELRSEEIDYNIQSLSNDKHFEKTYDAEQELAHHHGKGERNVFK